MGRVEMRGMGSEANDGGLMCVASCAGCRATSTVGGMDCTMEGVVCKGATSGFETEGCGMTWFNGSGIEAARVADDEGTRGIEESGTVGIRGTECGGSCCCWCCCKTAETRGSTGTAGSCVCNK